MEPVFTDLLQRANAALRAGASESALSLWQSVVAARPERAESWFNLAYVQRQLGRYENAAESYGEALSRGIARPEEAHLNRAVLLAEFLHRLDAAKAELERALQAHPGYGPALLNLGNLQEDLGDRDAAIEAYRRLAAADPDNSRALARLMILTDPGRELIERVEELAQHPSTPAEAAAELTFALGDWHDTNGRYDQAFAQYSMANRLSVNLMPASLRYSRNDQEAMVDAIIAQFGKIAADCGNPSAPAPIFICGMFRSGSTLAEQILAAHPDVVRGGELDIIPRIVALLYPNFPHGADSDLVAMEEARRLYDERLRQLDPGGRMVTDKRPDNILYVGLIKQLFPTAKFIITHRHALDNIVSVFALNFDQGVNYGFDLEDAAHWYRQSERLAQHWQSVLGDDVFSLNYDVLVERPRPTIEQLLAFCGLEFSERCMAFHEQPSLVQTPSLWQVRRPLYRTSSGRWKNYEKHLAGAMRLLQIES